MRQFFSLVGVLFKARYNFHGFKKDANKPVDNGAKKDNTWIFMLVLGLVFLPIIVLLAKGVAEITPIFAAENALSKLILFVYIITMLVIMVFGIINMLSYVYFNRDAEFLASLPIKSWKIFLCKLFMVYISELALAVISIVPLTFTIGIVSGQGIVFYIGAILSVFFVPAMPILIASVLAIPLMYLVSLFRKKSALNSIVVILLFGGLLAVYYYFYSRFIGIQDPEMTGTMVSLIESMAVWENIFYPIAALIRFCLLESVFGLGVELSALVNLLIVIGSFAVMLLITGFISNLVYHKSVISQSVGGAKDKAGKAEEYKTVGVFKALLKKEWVTLLREPAFAFQCFAGIVLGPVLTVFLSWQLSGIDYTALEVTAGVAGLADMLSAGAPAAFLIFIGIFSCAGMNVAACSAISREGKNFHMTKTMPVSYEKQIKAKLYISLAIGVTTSLISSVLGVIVAKLPFWNLFLVFGFLGIYSYAFACYGLKFDLNKPKLNWSVPNEAVKNSRSSTIPILMNMLIGLIVMIIMIVFIVFNMVIAMWIVMFGIGLLGAWFLHRRLYKNLDAIYGAIEE